MIEFSRGTGSAIKRSQALLVYLGQRTPPRFRGKTHRILDMALSRGALRFHDGVILGAKGCYVLASRGWDGGDLILIQFSDTFFEIQFVLLRHETQEEV